MSSSSSRCSKWICTTRSCGKLLDEFERIEAVVLRGDVHVVQVEQEPDVGASSRRPTKRALRNATPAAP